MGHFIIHNRNKHPATNKTNRRFDTVKRITRFWTTQLKTMLKSTCLRFILSLRILYFLSCLNPSIQSFGTLKFGTPMASVFRQVRTARGKLRHVRPWRWKDSGPCPFMQHCRQTSLFHCLVGVVCGPKTMSVIFRSLYCYGWNGDLNQPSSASQYNVLHTSEHPTEKFFLLSCTLNR